MQNLLLLTIRAQHIASHLKKWTCFIWKSYFCKKSSIENQNFQAISVDQLSELSVEAVMNKITANLN